MGDLKDFYGSDTEGETLGRALPDGLYIFAVNETEVGEWEPGRPKLTIKTKVAVGDYEGMYGPWLTLSTGGSKGTAKKSGREFEITDEDAAKEVRVKVKAIHSSPIALRNPSKYDQAMLEDIAAALTSDDVFIGRVVTPKDEDGNPSQYNRFSRIYPISEPPKGFTDPRKAQSFSL